MEKTFFKQVKILHFSSFYSIIILNYAYVFFSHLSLFLFWGGFKKKYVRLVIRFTDSQHWLVSCFRLKSLFRDKSLVNRNVASKEKKSFLIFISDKNINNRRRKSLRNGEILPPPRSVFFPSPLSACFLGVPVMKSNFFGHSVFALLVQEGILN